MAPQLWRRGREETTGEGLTGLAVSSFTHLLSADHMPGLGGKMGSGDKTEALPVRAHILVVRCRRNGE